MAPHATTRSLVRRGVDCLIGASCVYALLLVTAPGLYSGLLKESSSSLDGHLQHELQAFDELPALPTDAEPRSAIAAATAAIAAAEAVTREEGALSVRRSQLHQRLKAARVQLGELQQAVQAQAPALQAHAPASSQDERSSAPWPFADVRSSRCPGPRGATADRAPLSIDDVAFGVLTSERFVDTRLASQQRTWLRRVRHVVFYSESELRWLPTVKLAPPNREELVGGGAWKNFPALMDLHRRFPNQKWVFFHDDDTYVFVENLLTALGKYDPDRDYYVGLYWTPRVDMEWKEVQIAYASGGAGYAISRALLRRLAPTMPSCHGNYTRWAGDVRVGKCIFDLGVRITPAVGFHHEPHDMYMWDMSGGSFPYGHLSKFASAANLSPSTFHHLSVDQIALYNRMQLAESRGPSGELYRYDFAPFMLKEYIAYAPQLKHRFRLLFGISLEVGDGLRGAWRRDFSDPLYMRVVNGENAGDGIGAVEPAEGASEAGVRFEMAIAKVPEIFNGDGCSAPITDKARLPIRKATVIEIVCHRHARRRPSRHGTTKPSLTVACALRLLLPLVRHHVPQLYSCRRARP